MLDVRVRKTAALALIAVPILFNVFFALLAARFEYPDILREPTDYVLTQFQAGGAGLIQLWYGMLAVAVLFVPLAMLMHAVMADEGSPRAWLGTATACGVVAGAVQALGFLRWVFLVPHLAERFADPNTSEPAREALRVTFEAFHLYAGAGVGEHLGYLFTGSWTLILSVLMLGLAAFPRWLGWLGIVSAIGIVTGMLEIAGLEMAGTINALSYVLWSLWMIATGISIWRRRA